MVVMTILTGLIYPLAMTAISLAIFPSQANGSIEYRNGRAVGSRLIGQSFNRDEYLHGRPSAAGSNGYDGLSSGGTNLGPTNRKLLEAAEKYREQVRISNPPAGEAGVPSDLVTASASGLDPHISPEGAFIQAERIARARGMTAAEVESTIEAHLEKPWLGFAGEKRINVLMVNRALDDKGNKGR